MHELKIDYPKVPYPHNDKYFWKIVELGKQLRLIHTQEIDIKRDNIIFSGVGDNCIDRYKVIDDMIYINKKQHFSIEGQSVQEAWDYVIGGNAPLQKWLKDRKGLVLSDKDIDAFKYIVAAVIETQKIMNVVDELIML